MSIDFLIVGAGYAGSVMAERLAHHGKKILLIDRRSHIGGNAYDEYDSHGILIHRYGPHIFHTNSKKIFDYLSNFTEWSFYEHHVLAKVGEQLLPIPINQNTVNQLYGLDLDEEGVRAFYEKVRIPIETIKTSEDVVLNTVGKDLYEKFFRGYTRKQWGLDPAQLSSLVTARIPVRSNCDNRYFTDTYQFMPSQGYTPMFRNLLDHPNIQVELETDFNSVQNQINYRHLIFTGPIDSYFKWAYGKLPYRSLDFEHSHLSHQEYFQTTGTINYPNDYEYTRITEFKHLTGQKHSSTSIVKEFPKAEGDPYYPIPTQESDFLYKKYEAAAEREKNVTFLGRLAQYRYYNMDQVVGAALTTAQKIIDSNG